MFSAVLVLLAACSKPSPVPERVYVSDERGNAVLAIEPASGAVVQRIEPGLRPRGLALSPDGARLYVAVSGSPIGGPGADRERLPAADHRADGIAVVETASGQVRRVLSAGTDPETFALGPDGRTLFVSNEDGGMVTAVAADGGRLNRSVPVGEEPEGIAVTPDGARLYVACEASDHVAVLDARTLARIATIPVTGRPRGALMSADGASVYVTVEAGGRLAVISAADNRVTRQIDLARGESGLRPMGMVEVSNGHLFVTTGRAGAVIEVDPKSGAIVRRIDRVGARPWGIASTSKGSLLVTANGPSRDLTVIHRATGRITRRIPAGDGPWGVVGGSGGQS